VTPHVPSLALSGREAQSKQRRRAGPYYHPHTFQPGEIDGALLTRMRKADGGHCNAAGALASAAGLFGGAAAPAAAQGAAGGAAAAAIAQARAPRLGLSQRFCIRRVREYAKRTWLCSMRHGAVSRRGGAPWGATPSVSFA